MPAPDPFALPAHPATTAVVSTVLVPPAWSARRQRAAAFTVSALTGADRRDAATLILGHVRRATQDSAAQVTVQERRAVLDVVGRCS